MGAIDVERDLSTGLAERTRDRCLALLITLSPPTSSA